MLSDRDIMRAIGRGELRINNFSEDCLTPNGYDLRIGEVMIPDQKYVNEGEIEIPAMSHFLIGSMEYVVVGDKYAGQIWLKSKWARKGVLASFGLVDSGFEGILTMGAFAANDITINIGDKFAQLIFFELETKPYKTYPQRSGHYQGQKNIKI